jgi:hypothetical protein
MIRHKNVVSRHQAKNQEEVRVDQEESEEEEEEEEEEGCFEFGP